MTMYNQDTDNTSPAGRENATNGTTEGPAGLKALFCFVALRPWRRRSAPRTDRERRRRKAPSRKSNGTETRTEGKATDNANEETICLASLARHNLPAILPVILRP
ncbi:MAG: hypothetical protein IIZ93_00460 [Acidaminococcaceae bacterium]|nr:hypothetical protein [Acidaminococcaceae bacterium]